MKGMRRLLDLFKHGISCGSFGLELTVARGHVRSISEIERNVEILLLSSLSADHSSKEAEIARTIESMFQRTLRCLSCIDGVLATAQRRLSIFEDSPQEELQPFDCARTHPVSLSKEIVTISEAARLWQCSRGTIYNRIDAGSLELVTMPTGKRKGIRLSEMERLFGTLAQGDS